MVARLLDAAADEFDERGYRATTTNHVAASAGVSVGSLYQYFPNKDALLVGLAERHLDEAAPRLAALAARMEAEAPDAEPLCRAFVEEVAALNDTDRLHRLLWRAPRTDALLARLAVVEDAVIETITGHLLRLGHSPDRAPVRARLLVTAVDAAVHDLDPRLDRAVQLEELVRWCVAAVGRPD